MVQKNIIIVFVASTQENIYWIVYVNPKHDNLTWYEIQQFTIPSYSMEAVQHIAEARKLKKKKLGYKRMQTLFWWEVLITSISKTGCRYLKF